jgi:two-component system nitrogen regulation response regulator GlnG
VIKQAMLNASGHILLPEFLPESFSRAQRSPELPPASANMTDLNALIVNLLQSGTGNIYSQVLEAVERILLPQVLQHTRGHQVQASELLGINRTTLRHKLRSLGLAVDKVISENTAGEGYEG